MAALPLVKYSCDCIGFAPGPDGTILMVSNPAETDNLYGLYDATAGHSGKTFEPLDPGQAERMTAELARLVAWGHRLQEARMALGIGDSFS